jgi:hypothetical protein
MQLEPFDPFSDLSIDAKLNPHSKGFTLTFELTGSSLALVQFPLPSEKPSRKDELWKETCFECFFSVGGSNRYYEFNGSPSGDWALYAFDDYRQGMKHQIFASTSIHPVLVRWEREDHRLICEWNIPRFTEEFLDGAGITSVIRTADTVSYWAIRHAGEKPDFHLKRSFIHRLF